MIVTFNPKIVFIAAGFMFADILTGTMAAFMHSELNSTAAREGLFHKAAMLMLIAFGIFLDSAQATMDFGFEVPTCAAICSLIMLTECYSIVENFARMLPDELAIKVIELFRLNGSKFEYLYFEDDEDFEDEDDEDYIDNDPYAGDE